ncbi:MAG: chromosome condensation regulator, partial [Myxococcales bacterium]|nr:chromosome condensation regulator [Myxococcales bacterium]
CGNEALDQGEECDDGNDVDGDGCDNDCSFTQILQIAAGGAHTCALIEGGRLRCWGQNSFGQLGYGHANNIGDTETPASAGDVTLPGPVEAIALGGFHTCGLFADGELRCWGQSNYGQLGYGDGANNLGDDESLADLAPVELGANPATVLATSENHSCALLDNGKIRCWGQVLNGRLGLGMLLPQYGNYIGDDETPADAPQVFLGPDAKAIRAGRAHTCAITVGDQVRCWGVAASGRLGYGNQTVIGDDESPSDAGDVAVYPDGFMGTVSALALGDGHSCALYSNGEVRCWGEANEGQLGQGKKDDWGDGANEAPGDLPAISLGESAVAISAGNLFSCALLSTGEVRCWGDSTKGQLGLGDTEKIGDDAGELPDTVPVVDLGGTAIMIASGQEHSCVVLDDYRVLCWGANTDGRLGYGNQQTIGDTESPSEAGAIELF